MKIEFPSPDDFIFKHGEIAGDKVVLVTPQFMGTKWTRENSIFRSSAWTSDGYPFSLGLKKFTNWSEKSDVFPEPKSLKNCNILEKIDGSCCIVSLYKHELIVRTRGTFSAETLETGNEIKVLKQKYPKAFKFPTCTVNFEGTANVSLLYEWVGKNKIVIDYGSEPDIYLIGVVNHIDYSLWPQLSLDEYAKIIGVKRPRRYNFDSIEEMIKTVEAFQGVEGIVLYYNNDQNIKKVKGISYLTIHSLKSNLTSEKLAELFFLWGHPSYQQYCDKFTSTFDYECLKFAQGAISSLFDGVKTYQDIMEHLKAKYEANKHLSRKDFAISMLQSYGSTKKFSVIMNLYLNQETPTNVLKHILLANTKQCELGMFGTKNNHEA